MIETDTTGIDTSDARLIAEMLAALIAVRPCLAALDAVHSVDGLYRSLLVQVDDAISKAERR